MENLNIGIGSRITSHGMIMIITEETPTRFKGFREYKGVQMKNELSIQKSMFTNPHYMNGIKVLTPGQAS